MKVCNKCGEGKPLVEFGVCSANRDGLKNQCRLCTSAYDLSRKVRDRERKSITNAAYQTRNRSRIIANRKKFYTENQERLLQASKNYQLEHPEVRQQYLIANCEQIALRMRDWGIRTRSTRTAATKRWALSNPDKMKHYSNKRRALKLASYDINLPTDFWQQMLDFYGERCMYLDCSKTNLTLDHIVPLSKGGPHTLNNFQILCGSHNSGKNNKNSIDYRPYPRLEL